MPVFLKIKHSFQDCINSTGLWMLSLLLPRAAPQLFPNMASWAPKARLFFLANKNSNFPRVGNDIFSGPKERAVGHDWRTTREWATIQVHIRTVMDSKTCTSSSGHVRDSWYSAEEVVQSAWIRWKPAVMAVKLIPNLPVTRPWNYSCCRN